MLDLFTLSPHISTVLICGDTWSTVPLGATLLWYTHIFLVYESIPYDSLGWHPALPVSHDSPEVASLRALLEREAGMVCDEHGVRRPLEIVDPSVPGFAERAAKILRRDGHVIVRDVLDQARLATARQGVERVIREIVARDPGRLGNRGSHRYTFGPAAEAFGEQAAWAALIDPPALMAVMAEVFQTEAFLCGGAGGGDFALPGCEAFYSSAP